MKEGEIEIEFHYTLTTPPTGSGYDAATDETAEWGESEVEWDYAAAISRDELMAFLKERHPSLLEGVKASEGLEDGDLDAYDLYEIVSEDQTAFDDLQEMYEDEAYDDMMESMS